MSLLGYAVAYAYPRSKHKTIKTIGFTTRYRDKDKIAINAVLNLQKIINANVKCLYVKLVILMFQRNNCRMESGV
jgi:hypothetical protein